MSGQTEFSEVGKWGAIIVGLLVSVPVVAILSTQAPVALVTLIVVGFLAWAGIRSGALATEDADPERTDDADPLATLQERYAAGELTEAEFERRLDRLLESDRRAEDADGPDAAALEREREREGVLEHEFE